MVLKVRNAINKFIIRAHVGEKRVSLSDAQCNRVEVALLRRTLRRNATEKLQIFGIDIRILLKIDSLR